MTRDEIIKLAIDAGLYSGNPRTPGTEAMIAKRLQRFAELVAAAEREECARVCQDVVESGMYGGRQQYAAAACRDEILARGEKGQS
jgi:hypothetical protein